jgi:CRISPR-associated protein Csb2
MLTIAWQYLTGRCVATDFADRQAAEWPPHPDRLFQALVAAWGERGEDPDERKALEWLESLTPPCLSIPIPEDQPEPVKVYVPVNDSNDQGRKDKDKWKSYTYLSEFNISRNRQPRLFHYVRVGEAICALVWPEVDAAEYGPALERLCAEVIRLGHSSSLVRCRLTAEPMFITHMPSPGARRSAANLRVPERGRLQALVTHRKDCLALDPPRYIGPPPTARQIAYTHSRAATGTAQGFFEDPLLILRQVGGRRFTLRQTLDLTQTLRQTLIPIAQAVSSRARELVSGHSPSGAPLQSPHLAYLPLAFAGHPHADGRLLGLALAFPRGITPDAEEEIFQTLAEAMNVDREINLVLGAKGDARIQLEDRPAQPQALRSNTWCRASTCWATVTPIVLDRMQHSRRSDPDGWAADQIVVACLRQGIPAPAEVHVSHVSPLLGVPTVREFPALVRKDGRTHRQVHARITFAVPVTGPLVLGAGRYRGYGLCKPAAESRGGARC